MYLSVYANMTRLNADEEGISLDQNLGFILRSLRNSGRVSANWLEGECCRQARK
jgi:hypothetical protein